jgi:hypothetical protein
MVAGLATLAAFDDEDIVRRADRTGAELQAKLCGLAERYELIHDIRGLGLMVGIEFGQPDSGSAGRRFRTLERLRTGMFSQLVVVPLFHRHRIITQVAADNVNIIKLLPPLIAGPEEVDYFVQALDDVMADAHRGSGLTYEFGRTMARGALRRKSQRSVASVSPLTGPAALTMSVGSAGRAVTTRRAVEDGDVEPSQPVVAGTADGPPADPATAPLQASTRPAPGTSSESAYVPAVASIEPGDRVVITGAAGFIGSAVARAVHAKGAQIVALVQPGADVSNLRGLPDIERAAVDIRDAAAVRRACQVRVPSGCGLPVLGPGSGYLPPGQRRRHAQRHRRRPGGRLRTARLHLDGRRAGAGSGQARRARRRDLLRRRGAPVRLLQADEVRSRA